MYPWSVVKANSPAGIPPTLSSFPSEPNSPGLAGVLSKSLKPVISPNVLSPRTGALTDLGLECSARRDRRRSLEAVVGWKALVAPGFVAVLPCLLSPSGLFPLALFSFFEVCAGILLGCRGLGLGVSLISGSPSLGGGLGSGVERASVKERSRGLDPKGVGVLVGEKGEEGRLGSFWRESQRYKHETECDIHRCPLPYPARPPAFPSFVQDQSLRRPLRCGCPCGVQRCLLQG